MVLRRFMSKDYELDLWSPAFEDLAKWRQTERANMIAAIRDVIAEAQKKAKSPRAPAGERIRWTRLVGQLIWYKDQILRSMTYEALERDIFLLKREVFGDKQQPAPTPSPRRTTFGRDNEAGVRIKTFRSTKRNSSRPK